MITKQRADFLVLGAGILGLAVALELRRTRPGSSVLVVEKEPEAALHASGRNSGVVHAGFYYAPDSLKARFTAEGNRRLRAYCAEKAIVMNACSKVVVARDETELPGLEELARRGKLAEAGVSLIDEKELADIDPNARTIARALYSPNTVSVSPREVCLSFQRDLERSGVRFLFCTSFEKRLSANSVSAGGAEIEYGHLVNCAGLYADQLARAFGFSSRYTILPFKGVYLVNHSLKKNTRTNVYPVPNLKNPFLGVHFTQTAGGHEKVGPTAIPAFWRENYQGMSGFRLKELAEILHLEGRLFTANRFGFRDLALTELRKYSKQRLLTEAAGLVKEFRSDGDWQWGKAGIRAQLLDLETMALVQDFLVEGDEHSTHVLNAVSPAFTSALPFAEHVVARIPSR
jgi:L-2-hydroxyglutarate oxidase